MTTQATTTVFKRLLCFHQRLFHPPLLLPLQKRSLHVSHCHCKANNSIETFRQARFIKKLMTGSNRSRKKFFTVEQPVSKMFAELGTTQGGSSFKAGGAAAVGSKKSIRRVEMLNVLFLEQITSMLSTGEVSPEILGLGLTVAKVKVSSDFSRVNVYWVATGTSKDNNVIAPILKRAAGKLRHELTQRRVIGMVPPIEFVRDTSYSKVAEVEYLLSKCDFGEDFVPTASSNLFIQNPKNPPKHFNGELQGEDVNINESKSNNLDNVQEEPSLVPPVLTIPTTESELYDSISMRQDVLGVRHDVIRAQISQMTKRVRNKKLGGSVPVPEKDLENDFTEYERIQSSLDSPMTIDSSNLDTTRDNAAIAKKRQQEFFKYLKKQQISRTIQLKQLTTQAKDKEFYDQERLEGWKKQVFEMDAPNWEELEDHHFDDIVEEVYYSGKNNSDENYRVIDN